MSSNKRASATWMTRFWAIVKYELIWNIRKKKLLGMILIALGLATLSLVLPIILSNMVNQPVNKNPDFVISSGIDIGELVIFLFAIVTVMNSISGEFESGTIVPLLTKPVSRTMVFIGKVFAAFITLLVAYIVIIVYMLLGGIAIYGPQNNLYLIPLSLLGNMLSTFVWVAIVLSLGSLSKSSLIAALGTFGIFIALSISAPIVSIFSDQAWILSYLPGNGATGTIVELDKSISTGIDNIAVNLITYILHPLSQVSFFKIGDLSLGQPSLMVELYAEPLSLILVRSVIVALTYVFAFSLISWYALKRAQVVE